MLRQIANLLARQTLKSVFLKRFAHGSSGASFRVTVIGAAGGIGQPLSLLLKLNPLVGQLTLYDLKLAVGVAADISHIDRPGSVIGYECKEDLLKALKCADVVVVPAGMPRKPGQSREDLFNVNAQVVAEVADAIALAAPRAFLAIITNPINSTVPAAAEVLKKREIYDPSRLFGVTTLDIVRSRKFIGNLMHVDPRRIKVSVIGGHSGNTIIPLISNAEPTFKGDDDDIVKLTKRIQNAGTEIVEAKAGAGSATLSMAHAAAEFVNSLLLALSGRKDVVETAYVESCLTPAKFFASPILINKEGITYTLPLPDLSPYEDNLICEAMPQLIEDIKQGVAFGEAFQITEKSQTCQQAQNEK